jgi:hypothetical protein
MNTAPRFFSINDAGGMAMENLKYLRRASILGLFCSLTNTAFTTVWVLNQEGLLGFLSRHLTFLFLPLTWLCLAYLLRRHFGLRVVPLLMGFTGLTVILGFLMRLQLLPLETVLRPILGYAYEIGGIAFGLGLLASYSGLPPLIRSYGMAPLLSVCLSLSWTFAIARGVNTAGAQTGVDFIGAILLSIIFARYFRETMTIRECIE